MVRLGNKIASTVRDPVAISPNLIDFLDQVGIMPSEDFENLEETALLDVLNGSINHSAQEIEFQTALLFSDHGKRLVSHDRLKNRKEDQDGEIVEMIQAEFAIPFNQVRLKNPEMIVFADQSLPVHLGPISLREPSKQLQALSDRAIPLPGIFKCGQSRRHLRASSKVD